MTEVMNEGYVEPHWLTLKKEALIQAAALWAMDGPDDWRKPSRDKALAQWWEQVAKDETTEKAKYWEEIK